MEDRRWRRRLGRSLVASVVGVALLAAPAAARADVLDRVSPTPKSYVDGVDFAEMAGSNRGDVTAPVTAVDLVVPSPATNTSTSGCEASDFVAFPAGSIALLQRGTCSFADKASNAEAAGAAAVLIFNEGDSAERRELFGGTLGEPGVSLPVVGTTFAVGDELRNGVLNGPTGSTAHVVTDGDPALDPSARLNRLMDIVESSDMPNGTKSSLRAKLEVARSSLSSNRIQAACGQLDSFKNQVRAQTGNQIGEDEAELLIGHADAARTSLSC